MAPGLLPIQSHWDAPLVTALTAVSFWCFLVQPCFFRGTNSWYICCCCLRHSRGVSYALCEKREAHGPFWSVGFLGCLWGGAGWVRASPELLGVVGRHHDGVGAGVLCFVEMRIRGCIAPARPSGYSLYYIYYTSSYLSHPRNDELRDCFCSSAP